MDTVATSPIERMHLATVFTGSFVHRMALQPVSDVDVLASTGRSDEIAMVDEATPDDVSSIVEGTDFHLTLVVPEADGLDRAALDVRFDGRLKTEDSVLVWGMDASRTLHVRLHLRKRGLKTSLSWRPAAGVSPLLLVNVLDFLREARAGRIVELRAHTTHSVPTRMDVPGGLPQPDEGLEAAVRMLARVQRNLGVQFGMPEVLEVEDLRQLELADRLLGGQQVRGGWRHASLTASPSAAEAMLDASDRGESMFMTELTGTLTVAVAGQLLALGEVTERLLQARFADPQVVMRHAREGQGDIELQLVPGDDDRTEVVLRERPGFDPFDRSDAERVRLAASDMRSLLESSPSPLSLLRRRSRPSA